MKFCFAGDWAPVEKRDYGLGDQFVVGNLECAFANYEVASGKAYTSVLPTACIGHVAMGGFGALSVANNHAYDAGGKCFDSFVAELEQQNIRYFGTCERPFVEVRVETKRVAVIGCLEPCRSRGKKIFRQEDVIALIKKLHGFFDVVYIYPHWGKEGEYTRWPSPRQRRLARRWIDAGADGVFGSHSHVFQGREYYKGKPIYYSLGNFFFPHPESKLYDGTHDGLMVEIDDGRVVEKFHHFEDDGSIAIDQDFSGVMKEISRPLKEWSMWKWAKAVGAFNLKKNTASWHIRLKKNFLKTFPKFVVWQVLPQTLLFRVASVFGK